MLKSTKPPEPTKGAISLYLDTVSEPCQLYGGQAAKAGSIIVRQVGSTFHAGFNVGRGKDFTLFALKEGKVRFQGKKVHIDVA